MYFVPSRSTLSASKYLSYKASFGTYGWNNAIVVIVHIISSLSQPVTRAPIQNRVLPTGEIVAIPQRGTLMGNRGCLHDDEGIIRHRWKGKRWISCVLDYKDNRAPLRKPGRYTALFFKDEVSALAAGHRPCAKCRPAAFKAFCTAIEKFFRLNPGSLRAGDIDAMLHRERIGRRKTKRIHAPGSLSSLPVGAMVLTNGGLMEANHTGLSKWDWDGLTEEYADRSNLVVTPPTVLAALHAGYQPLDA